MVPKDPTQTSDKAVQKVMTKVDLNVGVQEESSRVPVDKGSILRNVLAIFYGQIQFTTLLIALFVFVEAVKTFVLAQEDLTSFLLCIWSGLHATIILSKQKFGTINFNKYTLAIVYTSSFSYFVATLCCKTKINTLLLAAGITSEIFFFLLVLCLFARIGDTIWLLISKVAGAGVLIFGLIIFTLNGSLSDKEFVILFLSFFIVLVLIDLHEILGIGWYQNREATSDLCLYSALALHRDVTCAFIFLVILLNGQIGKK